MEKNVLRETTALARAMCELYSDSEGLAVDATCGNGNDTLWMAKKFRRVLAFDIQTQAVENTRALMAANGIENVSVVCDSHSNMESYIEGELALVVFNLGWLPGSDKTVVTDAKTTVEALGQALSFLKKDGLLCVTMYWGHSGGANERSCVLEWASALDKKTYHCVHTNMINQQGTPPEILFVTRKK